MGKPRLYYPPLNLPPSISRNTSPQSNNDLPTPPEYLQNWNQEEELLSFFLGGEGTTGLTPPLPSFTPEGQGQVPKAPYPGPPMDSISEQGAMAIRQQQMYQQPYPQATATKVRSSKLMRLGTLC